MPYLALPKPDIGRFVDFEATRVELPRLGGQSLNETYDETLELFEGDDQPTPFGGQGAPRAWALAIRFSKDEHQDLADLVALLRLARSSSDRRLMLRTNAFTVEYLNAVEVVTIAAFTTTPASGRAWDFSCVANTVAYTVAV